MKERMFMAYTVEGWGFYLNVEHVVCIEDNADEEGLIMHLSDGTKETITPDTFNVILKLLGEVPFSLVYGESPQEDGE